MFHGVNKKGDYMKVADDVKQVIKPYIELLNQVLIDNPDDYEYKDWIPNCIECLEYAINTDKEIPKEPYNDLLGTINLLYEYFVNSKEWAYIELSQKFKTIYSGEQIGKALKLFADRLKEVNKEDETKRPDYVSFKDDNGNFKSTAQILEECREIWNNAR
jgi:hypothetical protein